VIPSFEAGQPIGNWRFPRHYIFSRRSASKPRGNSSRIKPMADAKVSTRKSFRHYGLSVAPLRRTGLILLSTNSECPWQAINRPPDASSARIIAS
jgi:hypothetical protein